MTHLRAPEGNSAPTIPATTKRAIDEWTAKGCRVIVEAGRIEHVEAIMAEGEIRRAAE